jgi:hypothetical protein
MEVVERKKLGDLLGVAVTVGEDRIAHPGVQVLSGAERKPGVSHVTDQTVVELDPTRPVERHEVGEPLDGSRLTVRVLSLIPEDRREVLETESGTEDRHSPENVPV